MTRHIDRNGGEWRPGYVHLRQVLGHQRGDLVSLVWWYAQGEAGYCNASRQRLANDLGLSKKTVTRDLHWLIAEGWLEDLTPQLRRRTHHLRPTQQCWTRIPVELPRMLRERKAVYLHDAEPEDAE